MPKYDGPDDFDLFCPDCGSEDYKLGPKRQGQQWWVTCNNCDWEGWEEALEDRPAATNSVGFDRLTSFDDGYKHGYLDAVADTKTAAAGESTWDPIEYAGRPAKIMSFPNGANVTVSQVPDDSNFKADARGKWSVRGWMSDGMQMWASGMFDTEQEALAFAEAKAVEKGIADLPEDEVDKFRDFLDSKDFMGDERSPDGFGLYYDDLVGSASGPTSLEDALNLGEALTDHSLDSWGHADFEDGESPWGDYGVDTHDEGVAYIESVGEQFAAAAREFFGD